MKRLGRFNRSWLIRVYDKNDIVFDSWEIRDRYEWEASAEAEEDVKKLGQKAADWTMTEILS